MTAVRRIQFREARIEQPKEFSKILEMDIPAIIRLNQKQNLVEIWPRQVGGIESNISFCRYELKPATIRALEFISANPIRFDTSPSIDVFERISTPGAGGRFLDELLQEIETRKPSQRVAMKTVLVKALH
ncbi:MAG: hypothetical protein ABR867_04480, partial [Nitrososphaerales archaeon]